MSHETIKLTQYSHGAGCGCKISPAVLDTILHSQVTYTPDARLLVGNSERDDAAVWDLGNGSALISTTDFFMPIVDDPFDFGRIAAANAISDVYAMGGKPVLAIAILGWPINKIPAETAQRVLEGARSVCADAGITISGGHSIDSPEPIFGLAVNGIVALNQLKQNSKATPGCHLYLTKPLGIGAMSTAQKKGLLEAADAAIILKSMTTLNKIGEQLSSKDYVKAMTDVTGFGLLGHLSEMCEGSGVTAEIYYDRVPVMPALLSYIRKDCIPGGTNRNWDSYGHKIGDITVEQRYVLADPQTSGGLLVAVEAESTADFESLMQEYGLQLTSFGLLKEKGDDAALIVVK